MISNLNIKKLFIYYIKFRTLINDILNLPRAPNLHICVVNEL